MFVKDFADEYSRYRKMGEKAMAQVSDEGLNRVVATDGNSIAMIVRHISGNLSSRFSDFLTSDGEKPSRDRDDEFAEGTFSRAEIDTAWASGWSVVEQALAGLTDADLERTVTIRGQGLSVHEALCRSVTHAASHVGQIVLLARIVAEGPWNSLSIPRGQSKLYNQNPTLEKAHRQ
ncbi:MAG TPA: DUF1572 family protein [Gemmatimonadaceae bacterium]|nr:DUF1572 family protein [Gemmatimonadaceae bacterium]